MRSHWQVPKQRGFWLFGNESKVSHAGLGLLVRRCEGLNWGSNQLLPHPISFCILQIYVSFCMFQIRFPLHISRLCFPLHILKSCFPLLTSNLRFPLHISNTFPSAYFTFMFPFAYFKVLFPFAYFKFMFPFAYFKFMYGMSRTHNTSITVTIKQAFRQTTHILLTDWFSKLPQSGLHLWIVGAHMNLSSLGCKNTHAHINTGILECVCIYIYIYIYISSLSLSPKSVLQWFLQCQFDN